MNDSSGFTVLMLIPTTMRLGLAAVGVFLFVFIPPPLASAQLTRIDLSPLLLEEANGYARTKADGEGSAAFSWPQREDVEITVTEEAIIYDGKPSPLVAINERASASRFEVDGLGTIEVRRFAGSQHVLYALVDARSGKISIGERSFNVRLKREVLTAKFDSKSILGIDLDGDGIFVQESIAKGDGTLAVREEAPAHRARRIGSATLVVDSVAADGTAMWVRQTTKEVGLEPGLLSPDAAFVRLKGDSFRLAGLRGKTVVLSWWATTCPHSAEERPLLNETAAAYAGVEDIVWLAVAMDDRRPVERFLTDNPYTPEVVMMTPEAEEALEGIVFPRHTVLDPTGRVVFDESGTREGRDDDLRAAIEAARIERR